MILFFLSSLFAFPQGFAKAVDPRYYGLVRIHYSLRNLRNSARAYRLLLFRLPYESAYIRLFVHDIRSSSFPPMLP